MSTQLKEAATFAHRARVSTLFFTAPWLFIAAQLPQGLDEILEAIFIPGQPKGFAWQAVILIPAFCLTSMLSTALTFVLVQQMTNGENPSLRNACRKIQNQWLPLTAAAFTLGAITGLGLLALVIPGIYLTAIYLFVPYLILSETTAPLSVSFSQSKKMASQKLSACFGFAILGFGLSVFQFVVGNIEINPPSFVERNGMVRTLLSISLRMSIGIVAGVLMDLWVSSFFINLRRKSVL